MPVTKDHFYSINTTQGHEISYYSMQYHTIWQNVVPWSKWNWTNIRLSCCYLAIPAQRVCLSIVCLFFDTSWLIETIKSCLSMFTVQRLVCAVASGSGLWTPTQRALCFIFVFVYLSLHCCICVFVLVQRLVCAVASRGLVRALCASHTTRFSLALLPTIHQVQ